MSAQYALVISEPTTTKAGKTARNRHYSIESDRATWTIRKFCAEHGIGLPALIARLRKWPGGRYGPEFMAAYNDMKSNRASGKYHQSGKRLVCPHCGEDFTRLECVYARRRKQRDATPEGHALRTMPAEFFGEGA